MKSIVSKLLGLVLALFLMNTYAQKSGHIDVNRVLNVMPEREKAAQELQDYSKQLQDELTKMQDELTKKTEDYKSNYDKMSYLIKQTREKEIQASNLSIQTYQTQ